MRRMKWNLAAAMCCLMAILLAGCAGLTPEPKQESLDERVKNYMQAQIDKDWAKVYSFFHSSYREKMSKEQFTGMVRKLSYKSFTIEGIDMLPSGQEAQVKVRIDLSFMGMSSRGRPRNRTGRRKTGGGSSKGLKKPPPRLPGSRRSHRGVFLTGSTR